MSAILAITPHYYTYFHAFRHDFFAFVTLVLHHYDTHYYTTTTGSID
jgi:hypothetical protein